MHFKLAAISGVTAMMGLGAAAAQAATFNLNIAGTDYTVVEADDFPEGGPAGNTVSAAGSSVDWSNNPVNNQDDPTLWHARDTWGGKVPAFTHAFNLYNQNSHEIITTVSGLPSNPYEVYLVYGGRSDTDSGILASLDDGASTLYQANNGVMFHDTPDVYDGYISASPLGVVNGTEFSVHVDRDATLIDRTIYYGVAYKIVPEPASVALLGLGGLIAMRRRHRC